MKVKGIIGNMRKTRDKEQPKNPFRNLSNDLMITLSKRTRQTPKITKPITP